MASTYSTSLRLELMATGDQSGTWGDTTNTNLGTLLEQSITGYLSKAMADTNQTLTNLNGASDEARNMIVEATGALTAGRDMIVPTAEKLYLFKNSTTGGFAVTIKTSAGTGVAVPMNGSRWVYCDGTNVVDGMSGPLTPTTSDSASLGTAAVMWSDLFLASGGVINWNNGALTLTQATETLTQTFTDAGATVGPVYDLYRDSSTPATNDILGRVAFNGEDSAGNKQEYGSIEAIIVDPTTTAEDGALDFYATVAGTRTRSLSVGQYLWLPSTASPTPTVAGDIGYNTATNAIVAGNGSGQTTFRPSPWETIETRTVSAASTSNFTDLSPYVMLRATGYLAPSVDGATLRIRTSSNNGSSYDSGASDYVFQYDRGAGNTADAAAQTTDSGLLGPFTVGNSTGYTASFTSIMYAFNKTNILTQIVSTVGSIDGTGVRGVGDVLTTRASLTARDAFQFYPSSGTITGLIILEGIRG